MALSKEPNSEESVEAERNSLLMVPFSLKESGSQKLVHILGNIII